MATVYRTEKTDNFTIISNGYLKDKRLSLKAKGLMTQMLSLPESWQYTIGGLSTINKESIDAIRSAIMELEENGYVERRRTQKSGRFSNNEYVIHEKPSSEKPSLENPTLKKPTMENPSSENPTLLSTNKSSTKESRTKRASTKDSLMDSVYDVVDYLNEKADTCYRASNNSTRKYIEARLCDGFVVDDFKRVIDAKCAEWKNDSRMAAYLRPETLFGDKFEGYLSAARLTKRSYGENPEVIENEDGTIYISPEEIERMAKRGYKIW